MTNQSVRSFVNCMKGNIPSLHHLHQLGQGLWIGQPVLWIATAGVAIALGGGINAAAASYTVSWVVAAIAARIWWMRLSAGMGDQRATREQVRELKAMARAERDAYERDEARYGLKLSVEFHRVLARMAGNAVLVEFLDQLVARTPLVVLAHQGPAVDAACSIDEHSQLVDALAAGDAARAMATMRAHLDALLARLDLRGSARRETDLAELLGVRRA